MKKIIFTFFLTLFLGISSFNSNILHAKVVKLQNEEKKFGDWSVFCQTDVMMSISHCKIAAKFFDQSSVISIVPAPKLFTEFLIIIPKAKNGDFIRFRVDKNDLILSKNLSQKDFGMIPLKKVQKSEIYNQMKNGDFLFLRYKIKESSEEITIKINLQDFRNSLKYYQTKVNS